MTVIATDGEHFACECCGHKTFGMRPPATGIVCPVCAWFDAPYWARPEGQPTLREAQASFLALGAVSMEYRSRVRRPLAEEARDADWLPFSQARSIWRSRLSAEFHRTFLTLSRPARFCDGDGLESHHYELAFQRTVRPTAQELEGDLGDGVIFLNANGMRYFLPALADAGLADGGNRWLATMTCDVLVASPFGNTLRASANEASVIAELILTVRNRFADVVQEQLIDTSILDSNYAYWNTLGRTTGDVKEGS